MTNADEPRAQRPTLEEFERLATKILGPIFARLGYTNESIKRNPLFVSLYYRNGDRTIRVYYEWRDDYMDIRYSGPGTDGLHNVFLIYKRLGRPYDEYRSADRSARARIQTLAKLVEEQVKDVLIGELEFRFSEADAREVIAGWNDKVQAFVSGLFDLVQPLGFLESTHKSRDWYYFRRPTATGHHVLRLDIGVRYFGISVNPYVGIRHNAVEELFREVHLLATKGRPTWGPDTSTINSSLYVLEGKKNVSLSIEQDVEFDRVLSRLHEDFVRIGLPFFEQGMTLDSTYQMLRDGVGTQWGFERHEAARVERELCLACLLERFGDVPPLIEGVAQRYSSGPYGPKLLEHFLKFVECLRSKYPDLPTAIH